MLNPKIRAIGILALMTACILTQPLFWQSGVEAKPSQEEDLDSLMNLPIEELFEITVTSVSKKEQKLTEAASAIYVLTQDDIRRSGINTIPELFRLVPGMQVAQVDASDWAISARGFNARFGNKLLVLIDGRSVYTHAFSGVFWDEMDLVLEDIERIEVIRGPGATLWGANAVNGVINIITKDAHQTQGALVSAGVGTEDHTIDSFRYGGKLDEKAAYRVWGRYYMRDASKTPQGQTAADDFQTYRGGMRMDWDASESNSYTVQAQAFYGRLGFSTTGAVTSFAPPFVSNRVGDTQLRGGNFLARWKHTFSEGSDMSLQFFYNRDHRDSLLLTGLLIDTYDLEVQHRFQLGNRQEIVWGLGQRFMQDEFDNSIGISFNPDRQLNSISNAFVQDTLTLLPKTLTFTAGSKFSINNFTGFEFQPSARLLWTPNTNHSIWTAVSRAVRTPNRSEDAGSFNSGVNPLGPSIIRIQGQPNFESEDMVSFELGYRFQPHKKIMLDIAAFYSRYHDLRSFEIGAPFVETVPGPPHAVLPITTFNKLSGKTVGVEAAVNWDVLDWWRLKSAFTWFQMDLKRDPGSNDIGVGGLEGTDPEFQWNLRSHIDVARDWEFDQMLYYVDAIKAQQIPSYFRLDLRLGWHVRDNLELSFVAQNLLDPEHPEWGSEQVQTNDRNLVQRSFFGKIVWRF